MTAPAKTIYDDGSHYLTRLTRAAYAVIVAFAVLAGALICSGCAKPALPAAAVDATKELQG